MLSTPPAFVLSQDQTLQFDILDYLSKKIVTYIVLKYIRARFSNYENIAHCSSLNSSYEIKKTAMGPFAVNVVIQFSRIVLNLPAGKLCGTNSATRSTI